MASAKIERSDDGYTVTLRSGDWHAEYHRDLRGQAYRIIRSHNGALVKRLPVSVDVFNDVLETAQQYAAAENAILLTLKRNSNAGVHPTFT